MRKMALIVFAPPAVTNDTHKKQRRSCQVKNARVDLARRLFAHLFGGAGANRTLCVCTCRKKNGGKKDQKREEEFFHGPTKISTEKAGV